jgi:hypothetical protein
MEWIDRDESGNETKKEMLKENSFTEAIVVC